MVTMWTPCVDEMFFHCSISNHAEDICQKKCKCKIKMFHSDYYVENILLMENVVKTIMISLRVHMVQS